MEQVPRVTHIAITVTDLDRSVAWYSRLFGSDPLIVTRAATFAWAAWPEFGLHQHDAPLDDVGFSELRPGLDHVAFKCADQDELQAWRQRLVELGIEHSAVLHEFYGSGLAFRDPDGIALEFFSPPPLKKS
jgi:catechol 2,3-dioxygenase-like lactoylglutathione lyase family enzyme